MLPSANDFVQASRTKREYHTHKKFMGSCGEGTKRRSAFTEVIVIIFSLFVQSCSTNSVITGERELGRGNYIEAQRAFERALIHGEDSSRAYSGLGTAKYFSSMSDPLPDLRAADSLSASPLSSTFLHALLAQKKGYTSEAIGAYSKSEVLPGLKSHTVEIEATRSVLLREQVRRDVRDQLDNPPQTYSINPNTLAVLPVAAPVNDSLLSLAAIGFADFLMTDLSKAKALTVIERSRLQDILTELYRSGANYDVSSLPKRGRLIGAAKFVDCSLTRKKKSIHINAQVVNTEDGKVQTNATESGSEEELFTIEKRIALNLCERLKINLTADERREILTPQTENLLAFYAYCRGLKAADQSNYTAAASHFDEAIKFDPAFHSAMKKQSEMKARLITPKPLDYLVKILFPIPDPRVYESLLRTMGMLMEAGFINAGNARRDGPTVLPFPPGP